MRTARAASLDSAASTSERWLGMTCFDGGDLLTTVPVAADGTASYTTGLTMTGTHTITVAYNDNCEASSGTTTVEVTVVPTPPSGLCLIACGSVATLGFGEVYNISNTYNIGNGGGQEPWMSGSDWGRKPH